MAIDFLILDRPTDPEQLGMWLENILLSGETQQLVHELSAFEVKSPATSKLFEEFESRMRHILKDGIRDEDPDFILGIANTPELLLRLEEEILLSGGEYWDARIAERLAATTRPFESKEKSTGKPARQVDRKWQAIIALTLLICACTVGYLLIPTQAPNLITVEYVAVWSNKMGPESSEKRLAIQLNAPTTGIAFIGRIETTGLLELGNGHVNLSRGNRYLLPDTWTDRDVIYIVAVQGMTDQAIDNARRFLATQKFDESTLPTKLKSEFTNITGVGVQRANDVFAADN